MDRLYKSRSSFLVKEPIVIQHLKIFRWLGSTPLKLTAPKISAISKPFLCLTMTICIVNAVHHLWPVFHWRTQGRYTVYLYTATKAQYLLGPPLFISLALLRRARFETFFNKLIAVQYKLDTGTYSMFKSILATASLHCLVIGGFLISRLYKTIVKGEELLWLIDNLLWVVYYNFLLVSVFQITYLIRCVGSCFVKLSRSNLGGSETKESVKDYIRTYNHLMDIAVEINRRFAIEISFLLLIMFSATLDMTSSIFVGSYSGWTDRIGYFSWLSVPIIRAYHVIYTFHKVVVQAEECNRVLLNHIIHHKSESLQGNPLVIVHLGYKKPLAFKACECFTIDYNLGVSMAAAYFTYTVIIYQLEQSGSSYCRLVPSNSTS